MAGLLNSRAGYVFETPSTDVRVDGGIMPARDVAGDGSWKVLRGEDVCFMTEAAKRRIALQRFSSDPWPAFSNVPQGSDDPLLHRALAGAGARVMPASGEIPLRRRYLASAWSDLVLPSYSYASIISHASATHGFSGSMPSGKWRLVYEGASYDYVSPLDWTDESVAKRMVGLAGATNPGSRAPDAAAIPDQAGVLRADDVRRAFWWMKGAGPLVVVPDVAVGIDYDLTAPQLAERDVFKWHMSSPGLFTKTVTRYKYVWNGQSGGFPAAYSRSEWTETGSVSVPDGVLSPTYAWRSGSPDQGTYTIWWENWSHITTKRYAYDYDEGIIRGLYQPSYGPVLSGLDSAHGGLPSALAGTRCAYMMFVRFTGTWAKRYSDTETPVPSPANTMYYFRAVCPGEVSSGNVVFDSPVDVSEVIDAVLDDGRVAQGIAGNPVPDSSSYLDGLSFTRSVDVYPFWGYLVFYDEPADLARHVPGWTWSPGAAEEP